MISDRLKSILSDPEIFEEAADTYSMELKKIGYKEKVKYIVKEARTPPGRSEPKNSMVQPPIQRRRYNKSRKQFLALIDNNLSKDKPRTDKLHHIKMIIY